MGMQVKAFALLFAMLFIVDAAFLHGEYRSRAVRIVSAPFVSSYGPGSPNYKPVQTR